MQRPPYDGEVLLAAILTLGAALYAVAWWRVRATEYRVAPWRSLCFVAGELTIAAALLSPLGRLAEVSLTLHMLQVALLMAVAAPLFVLARPLAGLLRLPAPAPLLGWFAPAVALLAWHIPAALGAAQGSTSLRAAEHATLLLAAILFWVALIRGWEGGMTFRGTNIFVASTAGYLLVLGFVFFLAPVLLYPSYDQPSIFGMTALEDQGLAGVVLWMPALSVLALCGIAAVMGGMNKEKPAPVAQRAAPHDR